MRKQVRWLVALGIGFVGYRIVVEFMAIASAVLIGLVLAGVTWAVTGALRPR